MSESASLIITEDVRASLAEVRALAALNPVRIYSLQKRLRTVEGSVRHLAQMNDQSVRIPGPVVFVATFWIEVHRKGALARRMFISSETAGGMPHPAAVWIIAEDLGFVGSIHDCVVWYESMSNGAIALHMVQRVSAPTPHN